MRKPRLRNALWVLVTTAAFAFAHDGLTQSTKGGGWQKLNAPFDVVEASIADIHQAMRDGELTARQLVQLYIDRIEAYDKQGPAVIAARQHRHHLSTTEHQSRTR